MAKIFWLDLETGGVDKKINPVLQISGQIEIDGEVKESFNYFVKPFDGQVIDPEALAVSHINPEDLVTFEEPRQVLNAVKRMMDNYVSFWDKTDKFHLHGYNSRFDEDFFREFFKNCSTTEKEYKYGNGFGSYFWTPSIDVMQIAARELMERRGELLLTNFKLKTVCEAFGIGEDFNWHDASVDIEATKQLYKVLTAGEKNGRSD